MNNSLLWSEPALFQVLNKAVSTDTLIITTTDTVLGLLARCTQSGFEALNVCKGRFEKPYLVLVRDIQIAKKYVDSCSHPLLDQLASSFWPGPLTMIFPVAKKVPSFMCSAEGTIALRVPRHAGLQKLLSEHEVLFSTSANKAGEPVPVVIEQLDPAVVASVAWVVHDQSETDVAVPSTIIDCTRVPITLIRHGALSRAALESVAAIRIVE